jgi:hypothetical protein
MTERERRALLRRPRVQDWHALLTRARASSSAVASGQAGQR